MLAAEAQSAPWWGVPLVAGLFTIVGIVAAQSATWIFDRRKARREDLTRWHVDRRQTYAHFLAALDRYQWFIVDECTHPDFDSVESDSKRHELDREVAQLMAEIQLIGTEKSTKLAFGIYKHVRKFASKQFRRLSNDSPELVAFVEFDQRYADLRDTYLASVRQDLDVK
jgi:hypothetical protein